MPFGMPGVVPSMAQLPSMDGAQMMMAQASGLMPGFAPPPTSSQGRWHDPQAVPPDADACKMGPISDACPLVSGLM